MSGPRTSGRLRKRSCVSYAPPADDDLEDLDQDTEEPQVATDEEIEDTAQEELDNADGENGSSDDDASDDDSDSDEDFHLGRVKRCKRVKKSKRKKNRWTPEKPKRLSKRQIFRWADLPGELRNIIYGHCLIFDTEILLRPAKSDGRNYVRPYHDSSKPFSYLNPNLLLVNKATYAEGGPMLYRQHFVFDRSMAMYIFLTSLSTTPKSWVREITLSQRRWEGNRGTKTSAFLLPAFTSLIGTTNLKHLHIGLNYYPYNYEKQIYGCAHWWLEHVKKQKGSAKKAARLIDVRKIPSSRPHPHQGGFRAYHYNAITYGDHEHISDDDEVSDETRDLRDALARRLE